MTTETQPQNGRPRAWLLLVLGLAVAALVLSRMTGSWTPAQATSATPARTNPRDRVQQVDPKELDIRLEALETARPDQGGMERNPFRFQQKAPPPPPPEAYRQPAPPVDPGPPVPPTPVVPPIPWKLTGFVEIKPGVRVAALSDCKGGTWNAREGEIVDGQYRVVRLQIESVLIEYLDGKGRQTLRLEGCPPR